MSESFFLEVGDGHSLHVARYGNPEGRPVLFLHGGPGSGCNESQRQLFDPARDHAIFLDQRGAGKSLPKRARHANTTAHLIGDIEALRTHLGIARWLVVGGSWGATLGLAYAQAHPDRVTGLALRAIFLGTRGELDWAFGTALQRFFPQLYHAFLAHLPPAERGDPLASYWRRILDPDHRIHAPAAWIWHDVERALSDIRTGTDQLAPRDLTGPLPSTPFMEAHYFANDCFLTDRELLNNIKRIAHIPAVLVQARYDLLCPPSTSARLARDWTAAKIVTAEMSGHSLSHPAVFEALKRAISDLA